MNLHLIPKDSILNYWITQGRFMEAPYSYLLSSGVSAISCLLRRNAYVDLMNTGVIYPTLSVILIGPTGIGKDTVINLTEERILREFMPGHQLKGITTEGLAQSLYNVHKHSGEPATVGYLLAKEMKALFGGKDYQEGMIDFLTDTMSEGQKEYSHSVRHNPFVVPNPTLILQAGSTEEWFHQLPKGALEGGFVPRCLVVVERAARMDIASPQKIMDFEDRQQLKITKDLFRNGLSRILEMFSHPREMLMTEEASIPWDNWYGNRHKLIGPLCSGYAQRARGHVLKLAMISAACRGKVLIELPDISFAIGVMNTLIRRLENVILPPTEEGKCIIAIKGMLPATKAELIVALRPKFPARIINVCLEVLWRETQEIKLDNGRFVLTNVL